LPTYVSFLSWLCRSHCIQIIDPLDQLSEADTENLLVISNSWLEVPRARLLAAYERVKDFKAPDYFASFALNRALELPTNTSQSMCKSYKCCCLRFDLCSRERHGAS
jgi:hypothetical protein